MYFIDEGFFSDWNYVWIDYECNIVGWISFWIKGVFFDFCEFLDCECVDYNGGFDGDMCVMMELLFDYLYFF